MKGGTRGTRRGSGTQWGPVTPLDSLPSRETGLPNHEDFRNEVAKARRLSRFGAELSQPVVEVVEIYAEASQQQADIDFSEATAMVGLCPDMCPEPERAERARKGNLDEHERLDGDRRQTTKFLAVKKYNRTADRDPELIRPLPVLRKTMGYLLELMDRPYGDDFLGLYNFLWDRMRAVRMDLRMQHIFNKEAISMLEQMIRLHIIAMHEFCEYNKGEGFSEGFDAHLNIEQMNKASMELFQMYEDHKRKGIAVPTEKEFRGYYALLKLDKHPGYKVEPAELSLDLAKMSSEVRHSPEISFARDVAKACRVGNYTSFFRLAKKATFLQACLMHAHFSKLRKVALDSLHSSFTSNKGMPLSQLEKMLAMEGEDIESFVVRHGFELKMFDEMYFVKAGAFLRDGDATSKRSPLIDKKKSDKIKSDVCLSPEGEHLPVATPERKVDASPLLPLPPPPVCTGLVPVMEASDTFETVLSRLSALKLAVASGDQEDASIREHDVEVAKLEKCKKRLFVGKLKASIAAMPDVHAKVLEEARADDESPDNGACPVKRRKTCEKMVKIDKCENVELLKETLKPTIPIVPDMHAKILEEARADDVIPDNMAMAVKKRKCDNMELKPTIQTMPEVQDEVFEEARADDEIPDNMALAVKRRKKCEKLELKPTIQIVPDVHGKVLEEARADDEIPDNISLAMNKRKKCEKMELMPTIQTVPDVHPKVLGETRAGDEIPDNTAQPVKRKKTCEKIVELEKLKPFIPTAPDFLAELFRKERKQWDKFNSLLAQCIKVQDEIDEKLYFYF